MRKSVLLAWRRALLCWWGGCDGLVEYRRQRAYREHVYWRCPRCGRMTHG